MANILQLTQVVFVLTAVFQDIRKKSIAVWVFLVFGLLSFVMKACLMGTDVSMWFHMGKSMAVGIGLWLVSKGTRGAVGEGDGCFFMVTGIYLGVWDNLALLLYGLLFCSLFSLGIVLWGMVTHVSVGKKKLPFLPFLLIPGVWLVIL